ncbi:Holliday junction resolvase RecU [Salibacterium salarium]|uniref:Holliday junction resolvase RecU n=1 Tax=Salibacterium salarium TaxID=284579 RepID=A0A428N583_9BACI|nr:Holliday junction resolvase RecU [Salibacterium salarium]RSL33496.1 Holliday junction resolvase RecU [Salibacterium salarium]
MAFRYPGGKKYVKSEHQKMPAASNRFANRGMSLEHDLNETNKHYNATGQAVIHKKPTPVQIVNVDYPKRSAAKITEAYFKQPSTTDYNGIYRGNYIDFEAKETKNKTSFPFGNIHPHQVDHMQQVLYHGGLSFLIIRFSILDQTYLYDASHFIWWYKKQSHRKSIPKQHIEENGHLLETKYAPRIDYLEIVDTIYLA